MLTSANDVPIRCDSSYITKQVLFRSIDSLA